MQKSKQEFRQQKDWTHWSLCRSETWIYPEQRKEVIVTVMWLIPRPPDEKKCFFLFCGYLQGNFCADHLVAANSSHDLDRRLQVRRGDVVRNFENNQTFVSGSFPDRIRPRFSGISRDELLQECSDLPVRVIFQLNPDWGIEDDVFPSQFAGFNLNGDPFGFVVLVCKGEAVKSYQFKIQV